MYAIFSNVYYILLFFVDLSTYILKILRVWHWGPSYRFSIQWHVLGGDAHVPPFRHGGLQTAVENTHLKHDMTKNINSIINNEIHYNLSTMNSCKIKLESLPTLFAVRTRVLSRTLTKVWTSAVSPILTRRVTVSWKIILVEVCKVF